MLEDNSSLMLLEIGKENSTSGNYAGYLAFQTIADSNVLVERMRITSVGNVGIGTTSPTTLLHLERPNDAHNPFPSLKRYLIIKNAPGYGVAQVGLTLTSLGSNLNVWDIYNDSTATNTLRFAHGTSETGSGSVCMAIASTGNVGIGTDPGNVRLVVNGNAIITGSVTSSNGMLVSNGGLNVAGVSSFDGNVSIFESSLNLNGSGGLININDGELRVTGSASITNVLTLPPVSPLPSGKPTGSLAVSGSGANCKIYFFNGSWNALF